MSEFPHAKSNKTILILANNDLGLCRFRKDLIMRLLELGFKVYISLPDGELIAELERLGCVFLDTAVDRRGMNPLNDGRLFRTYCDMLRRIKPDMVITYTVKPNIYGGLACRRLGIPYAANITGLGSAIENGGMLRRFVLSLYKPALKGASVVFFENAGNRDALVSSGVVPVGRDVVLNGAGVNLSDYTLRPYHKQGAVRFLFAGRVMHEKGVDELFSAAGRLKQELGDGVEFHIAGSFEEAYKPLMNELEAAGTVEYHGYCPDIGSLYDMASCVVLPSYHEGMSNVLLEAAASGRPLITSDIPGCREAVEDGLSGFLCPPQDADRLYDAMKRFAALDPEARCEMGLRGRRLMESKFDKSAVVGKTVGSLGILND